MVDPNNCVLLLNELDDHGFVERRRDPQDRRRHIVVITAAGLKALAEGRGEAGGAGGRSARQPRRRRTRAAARLLAGRWTGQDPSIDLVCERLRPPR